MNLTSALVRHESAPVLEPWRQKDELVERRVLARTQGRREFVTFGRRDRQFRGKKNHVVILHLKKIRRAKALPELNPAAIVKDNKKRVFIEQQQKDN